MGGQVEVGDGGGEVASGGVEGEGISEEASDDVEFDDDEWGGPGWSYEMFAGTPGDEAAAETPRDEEYEVAADAPRDQEWQCQSCEADEEGRIAIGLNAPLKLSEREK